MFSKVGFIASLSITVPSSETFLARCYSQRRILAVKCVITNSTLWWKFTIACRVEHIHRKPLQMHNYEYQTHHQTQFWSQATKTSRSSTGTATVRPRLKWWKKNTILEFSWMYRITWLERYIKGSISSKGSLSGTILVRKYEIFKSASYMYMALNNLDLANEICDEVSREICLSSICSIKAVYLRQLNTGNSLFVISSSIDLFLQVGDWNGISS